MIHLLIKAATKDQACQAALDRGIILHRADKRFDAPFDVLAMCDNSYILKVMDWFGEPGQAPFPLGSLLHFSDIDMKEDVARRLGHVFYEPNAQERQDLEHLPQDVMITRNVRGSTVVAYSPSEDRFYEIYDHGDGQAQRTYGRINED